jgi:FixJ family two-component response regulator
MSSQTYPYVAVIDDDDSLCRSLGRLLYAAGIRFVTYSSAEAFLCDSRRPHFDCLLLDIQLSGMSGIELSRELEAAGSTTPLIFITAFDEPEVRQRALQSGCAAYLRKTDPAEIVLRSIRAVARGTEFHKEFPSSQTPGSFKLEKAQTSLESTP